MDSETLLSGDKHHCLLFRAFSDESPSRKSLFKKEAWLNRPPLGDFQKNKPMSTLERGTLSQQNTEAFAERSVNASAPRWDIDASF